MDRGPVLRHGSEGLRWKGKSTKILMRNLAFSLAVGVALIGPAGAAEIVLRGRVTDPPGSPLGGVQVRAFSGGRLAGSAFSDADGRYRVAFPIDPAQDPTVVVWWLPATADRVPELAILRESRAALEARLFSRCLPRVPLADSLEYDPVLRGEQEKLDELAGSGCLPETPGDLPEAR